MRMPSMPEPQFPKPPPLPPFAPDWYASITHGRWLWTTTVSISGLDLGRDYLAWSRRHAEWRARRLLARREREHQRSREAFTIRLNDEQ